MEKHTSKVDHFVSLLKSLEMPFVVSVLNVVWKIVASVRSFSRTDVTPRSFECLERRLECLFRELARLLLQRTVNLIESPERPKAIDWEHRTFRPYCRTFRTMETRVGTIRYRRWLYRSDYSFFVSGIAPLDRRLGLTGNRVSPGVAHKLGRLAADMPQQPALQQLREQFGISLSVEAYRKIVEHLSREIRFLHDDIAIEQLQHWMLEAEKTSGKHDVLLLVGRDGVHVPLRESWKEAACATLAVYDQNRRRLGTVYLGEMPQEKQVTMTERLTKIITGVLQADLPEGLKLRYVTDAGSLPRSYFEKVLSRMKHPRTGQPLQWSWGVDFFHACEYVSLMGDTLFGVGTAESQAWFKQQRHALRHDRNGVQHVLTSAAQIKRRHQLKGSSEDYERARGYLDRYRSHMDFATRRAAGDPIGSGITEAGCKVIFNQRMKQSGMRWSKRGGQTIVDLRTACRSRLWDRIWQRGLDDYTTLPDINQVIPLKKNAAA